MSEFRIEVDSVEREATNMDSICKDMKQIGESIKNISNQLSISGDSAETVKTKLLKMQDEIISNAAKVSTLQGAIREIAANYIKAENEVSGQSETWGALEAASNTAAAIASLKSLITKIRERINKALKDIKEKWKKITTPISKTQEKEHDAYMMSEIAKVQSKYAAKWNKASASEREKMLKEYMNEVCKIMGISVKTSNWTSKSPDSQGYITLGSYNPGTNSVWVNQYAIKNWDASLLTTMTHELRHAYQHQAIKNPKKYSITQETANEWKNSFNNYLTTSGYMRKYGVSQSEAFKMYQNQAVEKDARWFAGQD